MQLGCHLSSEEHDATTLVRLAARAEEVGFGFFERELLPLSAART